MRTDKNGCSTCINGHESYDIFRRGRRILYQYDYRADLGELFSCVALSLDACRIKRDNWIKNQKKK